MESVNNECSSEKNTSNEVEQQNESQKNSVEYPSSELILSVSQKEYEYTVDTIKSLETRTNIFITLAGVLLVYLPNNIYFPKFNSKVYSLIEAIPKVLSIIIVLLTFTFLFCAFICFILVLSPKKYKRLPYEPLKEKYAIAKPDKMAKELYKSYAEIIIFNEKVNEGKMKIFTYGLYFIFGALICTSMDYIISMIIK